MRDLTEKLKGMPKCTCNFQVFGHEYTDDGFDVTHCACGGVVCITGKFDITNHEFSDKDIRLSNLCESKIELAVDDCGIEHYFTLQKSDAIAIAKALGVTGEDLK